MVAFISATANGQVIPWDSTTMTVSCDPAPYHENYIPDYAVNGAGLDSTGLLHNNLLSKYTWMVNGGSVTHHTGGVTGKAWIEVDLGTVYNLEEMWVWNADLYSMDITDRGLRKVTIEYSTDGDNWNTLSSWTNKLTGLQEFAKSQPMTDNYPHETEVDLNFDARYVVITANTADGNWGAGYYMLAELRFFGLPMIASVPEPTNGKEGIATDTTLNWTAGGTAVSHDVYFGTNATDVENATHSSPEFKGNQSETVYPATGTLDLSDSTTYYWRVDEVDSASNVYKGNVWSFSTIGLVIPTGNITATSRGSIGGSYDIQQTIDLSGLSTGYPGEQTHTSSPQNTMWLDNPTSSTSPSGRTCMTWARYSFDRIYTMGSVWIWNANQGGDYTTRSLKDVSIDYSTDGVNYTHLGDFELPMATGLPSYLPINISLNGLQVKDVVISATSNWGSNYYGLSEVQFCPASSAATAPNPANNGQNVASDSTVLSWLSGIDAVSHDLYFGTDYDEVNSSVTPTVSGLTATQYPSSGFMDLDFGETYYWRVDEVDASNNVTKGRIWSFTTADNSVAASSITATASGQLDSSHPITRTIDGSGLTDMIHSTIHNEMWLDNASGTSSNHPLGLACKAWAKYEFDQGYQLSAMRVWNYNQSGYTNRGLRNVRIDYSTDGVNFTHMGDYEWPMADGTGGYTPPINLAFDNQTIKAVVITAAETNGNWGGNYYGFSEVQFALSQNKATFISPVDSLTGAGVNPSNFALEWQGGLDAVSYNVYLSENLEDVESGTASVSTGQSESAYPATGTMALEFDTDYYWRVDTVSGETVYEGDIWAFHTAGSLLIENFSMPEDVELWTCNKTGDWLSYEEELRYGSVPGSLKIEYDNSEAPYVTKATHTFDTAQDWAGSGGVAIRLFVTGDSTNYTGHSPLFVTITDNDSTPHSATVYNPDPNVCQSMTFRPWDIPLSEFTGVNMFNVKSISVGVGDGSASGQPSGDKDTVYFDYIMIYPPRCAPELYKAPGDLNSDCAVDLSDLSLFVERWMDDSGEDVIPPSEISANGEPTALATTSPLYAVNGAGLDSAGLLHRNQYSADTWQVDTQGEGAITHHRGGPEGLSWIQVDFGKPYQLDKMWVWNLGKSDSTGDGLRKVDIQYSADGYVWYTLENWANLLTGEQEFAESLGTDNYAHETEVDFGEVTAQYVVISSQYYDGNWDFASTVHGLAELRFFTSQSPADLNADGKVNFKDFSKLASDWQSESLLWPQF
jgi:hypothetical protein